MSQAKRNDEALVSRMLREAVRWFHEARGHAENEGRDLYELARECANGTFQNLAWAIPEARREIVARKYMDACRARFAVEVTRVLPETVEAPEYVA
jgi:hypothetical protein